MGRMAVPATAGAPPWGETTLTILGRKPPSLLLGEGRLAVIMWSPLNTFFVRFRFQVQSLGCCIILNSSIVNTYRFGSIQEQNLLQESVLGRHLHARKQGESK